MYCIRGWTGPKGSWTWPCGLRRNSCDSAHPPPALSLWCLGVFPAGPLTSAGSQSQSCSTGHFLLLSRTCRVLPESALRHGGSAGPAGRSSLFRPQLWLPSPRRPFCAVGSPDTLPKSTCPRLNSIHSDVA